jgi:hypothetical protein
MSDDFPWIDFSHGNSRFIHPATRGLYDAICCVDGVTACAIAINTALETTWLTGEGITPIELPHAHVCIVVMPHDIHPSQHKEIAQAIGDNLPYGLVTIGSEEAEWTGHDGDRRIVRWFDETLGGRNPYLTFTASPQEPQP